MTVSRGRNYSKRNPAPPLTDGQRDLAAEHFRLARHMAKPFKAAWPMFRDEFESASCRGLIDAARSFDPLMGCKFTTLANRRIRGELLDVIRRRRDPFVRMAFDPESDEVEPGEDQVAIDSFEERIRPLSRKHRDVCRGIYLHGKRNREVAIDLGCSASLVSRLRTEAIEFLKSSYRGSHERHRTPEVA